MSETCNTCNSEVMQHFCPVCGRQKVLPRIDGKYLLQEIRSVLSFEKGFLLTIQELLIQPGQSVRDFLREDRNRLVKPIVFLIVTSLIYSLINSYFQFEENYVSYSGKAESTNAVLFTWVQLNYGYANILISFFIGLWLKLFFRKYDFNYFEILVLLCFVMGFGMLIFSLFGVMEGLTGFRLMQTAGYAGFIYVTWAIGQFYGKRKIFNYVKAFFAYVLGMFTFALLLLLIGNVIDVCLKI